MNSFYDCAGSRIRELREINRFTREELAELAEISPKFLYEIETNQKGFSAETLYKLSKVLCVSCEYILSGINNAEDNGEVIETLKLFNTTQLKTISKMLKLMYELQTI